MINGATPASGNQFTLGSSGTLQITGAWLTADGNDMYPAVTVQSGSGLSLGTVQVVNDGQLNVSYSVGTDPASAGGHGVVVTTTAGTSNTYIVTVGDPTPAITGISPNPWNSGQSYNCSIQITGTGFGTNPTVQITSADGGIEIASYSVCSSSNGWPGADQITLSATTNTSYSPGAVYVRVTSRGYNGNSFQSSQQNNSNQSPAQTVPLSPSSLPTPTIVLGQGQAACQTPTPVPSTVVIGQQIAFTACIPAAVQGLVRDEQWSPSLPTALGIAVAGYNVTYAPGTTSATSAAVQAVSNTTCGSGSFCSYQPFYWVSQGGPWQFQFTYHLTNGSPGSSTLTFNVAGPTGTGQSGASFFAVLPGTVNAYPPSLGGDGSIPEPTLAFGSPDNPGIVFRATASAPAGTQGSFQWVQLVLTDNLSVVANPQPTNGSTGTGLDGYYPYQVPAGLPSGVFLSSDSPATALVGPPGTNTAELARSFAAQMFLMWDPALPGPGQPGPCQPASTIYTGTGYAVTKSSCTGSIPVPLGYMLWGFSGDVINSLQNQSSNSTTWVLSACSGPNPAAPAFVQSSQFPRWTTIAQ